jgi:hypothetical protein
MTETMIRDRAARLQIELDSLCDEAGGMGFSIEVGRRTGDGRARFATYDIVLHKTPKLERAIPANGAVRV